MPPICIKFSKSTSMVSFHALSVKTSECSAYVCRLYRYIFSTITRPYCSLCPCVRRVYCWVVSNGSGLEFLVMQDKLLKPINTGDKSITVGCFSFFCQECVVFHASWCLHLLNCNSNTLIEQKSNLRVPIVGRGWISSTLKFRSQVWSHWREWVRKIFYYQRMDDSASTRFINFCLPRLLA